MPPLAFRRRLMLVLADMLVLALLAWLVFSPSAHAGHNANKCVTVDDIYLFTARTEKENRAETGQKVPFFIREIPSSRLADTIHVWVYYRGEDKGYIATITAGCLALPLSFIPDSLFMGIMTPQERRVFLPHLMEGDPA